MKKTRSRGAPGSGLGQSKFEKPKLTLVSQFPQVHPAADASLDRLSRYRVALDNWHASGRQGRLPQPRDSGLRLPDLDPAQVLWGAA